MNNDLRYALRALRKSPVFTFVAVLSLALGIGANTAIFTLLDQILLRLLPVKNPQELVMLTMKGFHYGGNWGPNAISYPMYRDFKDHNEVFSGMFGRFPRAVSVGFDGHTERVNGEMVTGDHFQVLGVGAAVGRTFTAEDDRTPDGHPVLMLSYAYWKSRFAGDASVVGKTMTMNGHNYTVVGVAQEGFDGVELGNAAKVFVPAMMLADVMPGSGLNFKNRRMRWVNTFARLKPGVSMEQAQAALQPYFHGMLEMEVQQAAFNNASAEVREKFLKNIITVIPGSQGRSFVRQRFGKPLWLLMAITGGVLLIACANVASLLIARAAARQKEIAIRLAMGAGRVRILRQLLVESLLLSVIGGVVGLVLSIWIDWVLMKLMSPAVSGLKIATTPDLRILLFAFGVSILTGIIFGFVPALQSTRPDVAPTLKDQVGGIVGGGGGQVRLRKALVAAQVTLSLLLLVGAGLFIRSLHNLRDLGPGFQTANLVSFNLDPSLNGYDGPRSKAFYSQVTQAIQSVPGVRSVGLSAQRILTGDQWDNWVTVEGFHAKANETPDPYMNSVGPGYFETLGVPMVAGRDFTVRDTETVLHRGNDKEPRVVLVNEKFAKKFFNSAGAAVGRHVGFGIDPNTKTDMEIIGVFKDIPYTNLKDELPIQMCRPYLADDRVGGMTVYVRTTMNPEQFFAAVRAKVRELDSNLPVYSMMTLDTQLSNSLLVERAIAWLSTVFGFLATLLAIIGLYGVMAYTVARRTREIGIRMALGAFQGHVIWMVMREVLVLVAIGVVTGIAASLGLTRFVQAQLFGVTAHDPVTLVLAAVGLGVVACGAGYIPALRASRVDAMSALRYE